MRLNPCCRRPRTRIKRWVLQIRSVLNSKKKKKIKDFPGHCWQGAKQTPTEKYLSCVLPTGLQSSRPVPLSRQNSSKATFLFEFPGKLPLPQGVQCLRPLPLTSCFAIELSWTYNASHLSTPHRCKMEIFSSRSLVRYSTKRVDGYTIHNIGVFSTPKCGQLLHSSE